ncbi:MAG: hypothetical protein KGR26_04665 [Cyanobacteria bacterium REEB65]|nr:hypothetical protein [Cyanobacteria bacterium REEB65]
MADHRLPAANPIEHPEGLVPLGPYDMVRSLSRIVCAVVATRHPMLGPREQLLDTGEFPLAMRLAGSPVLAALRQDRADGPVHVRILEGTVPADRWQELMGDLRRILCLDHDLIAFYRVASKDPVLVKLTERYRGLRLALTPTPFQGLCHSILFQQISYVAAQTVERRFQQRFGDCIEHAGRNFWLSPLPDRVAALSEGAVRSIGIPLRKGLAILTLAREIVEGRLDLFALAGEQDADSATGQLIRYFGIGPWTAHHALIRAMGTQDCLPYEDPGLRVAVAQYYRLPGRASAEDVRRIGEAWRPWRSYASYYFWNTFWEPAETFAAQASQTRD